MRIHARDSQSKFFMATSDIALESDQHASEAGHVVAIVPRAGHRIARVVSATKRGVDLVLETRDGFYTSGDPGMATDVVPSPGALYSLTAPDIVYTLPAARRIGPVAQWFGIPHVATLHINYDAREHARCDGLIAIASWQKARIPADVRDKVAVIHPWLPSGVQKALSDTAPDDVSALRQTWHADDSTFVFGSVGRLVSEKGMDVLVGAFRAAFPFGDEPVRLVIVGEGPQRSLLQDLAGRDSRIVLAGLRSDVARYYRAFDAFVSARGSSRSEWRSWRRWPPAFR